MTERIDYDAIAERYDDDPIRRKPVDPALVDLVASRPELDGRPSVLDVGCGTGAQQVANQAAFPEARLVGLDPSHGMLAVARRKSVRVRWVRGQGEALPFGGGRFHMVTNQFSYHHSPDKPALFAELRRVLTTGGRLELINICPHEMPSALLYRYFPQALEVDARHFVAPGLIEQTLRQAGFSEVSYTLVSYDEANDLSAFLKRCRNRSWTSQLTAITDAGYRAGIEALERDAAEGGAAPPGTGRLLSLRAIA